MVHMKNPKITHYFNPFLTTPLVTSGDSITQTPEVLVGGAPPSFEAPPTLDFTTFRGCLYDFTYSITEGAPYTIIAPDQSTFNQ